MNDSALFYNSFLFRNYHFSSYRCSDNSNGVTCHFFAYMTRGNARLCEESRTVVINEGDVFYIPNGCKYRSYWYGSPEIEFISLGFRFLPNFENRDYDAQVIPTNGQEVEIMKRITARGTLDYVTVADFYTLVSLLMPNMVYRARGKRIELIEKAERILLSHPDYTVRMLARQCAVSESALYSAFQKYSSKSINEIKKSIVLEKAKSLLISTDYSVEEISSKLNFSSGAYFRKCFKEKFGISPREMRKSSEFNVF